MKSRNKLCKNCSIHGKNRKIFVAYTFWTPVKSNIPDVWNWNCWTLFGLETKVCVCVCVCVEGGGKECPPPPQWLRPCWDCHSVNLIEAHVSLSYITSFKKIECLYFNISSHFPKSYVDVINLVKMKLYPGWSQISYRKIKIYILK